MIIRLREFPESRRVPILILSAYQGEKLADAIKAGANQAMQKPVQLGSLVKLVKHLLVTLPQWLLLPWLLPSLLT
jgi:CheY-like chemotaxis protein